jgi:membrane-bound lytic murein transglycosylase D
LEVTKPVVEIELAEVGEVYATGETLIEWTDPASPSGYVDLWERIRAGFGMPEMDTALVQRHEAWYLNRPEYVERMITRSRRYLFHIVEEVEKRHMPSEIALLPMIESAFNPAAYSHMHAAGMWQFIPSTGRKYGLQQTWWYDGRRDVLEATRAALDYLQYLHDMFDDWQLALAAYNWGEGAVQRVIDKNRRAGLRTDYMSLTMPKETRNYLPKLQAVKNIVSDPDLFNVTLDSVPNRPYFAIVTAPSHIDVAMAAKLANVPLEEFRNLNPAHYRPVITSKTSRQLLVPVDKAEVFQANLESNDQPLVTWQTYQLKRGERLDSVARKFSISQQRLCEVNGLSGSRRLRPGQMLLVPRDDDSDTNLDETYASPDFQAPINDYHKRAIYRVKRGDTLASIARRNRTTVAQLKQWNGLRTLSVYAGQRLTIWQEAQVKAVRVKAETATRPAGRQKPVITKTGAKQKAKAVKPTKAKKKTSRTAKPKTLVEAGDARSVRTASR